MLIAGVLCLGAAVLSAAFALWSLSRPRSGDTARVLVRAMAPTQLADAVILAAGGTVALAAPPPTAVLVVIVSVAAAVGTVAVGSWQTARSVLRRATTPAACRGTCAGCSLTCR